MVHLVADLVPSGLGSSITVVEQILHHQITRQNAQGSENQADWNHWHEEDAHHQRVGVKGVVLGDVDWGTLKPVVGLRLGVIALSRVVFDLSLDIPAISVSI